MHPLSSDDMHLLWRFRFSLTSDRHALTKFLRSVDWTDAEVSTAATRNNDENWDDADQTIYPVGLCENPVWLTLKFTFK